MKKTKIATAPKKVLVSFIQDRSGSMSSVWEETLSGFKTYVEGLQADQKKDNEIEYIFSLTTFDTQIDTPYLGVPIATVDGGKLKSFGPRGGTALYDAIGKTLQAHDEDKTITFDKAIVLICTDGQENQSREWKKEALHAAIDERIKRGNWTFTYLGTQPETWADATSLGMGVGASANYTAQNAGATYDMMAQASVNMARSVIRSSSSFLHDNSTPTMRASVGMKTEGDAFGVPVGVTSGFAQRVVQPVKSFKTHPPIPPPVSPVASSRKWK